MRIAFCLSEKLQSNGILSPVVSSIRLISPLSNEENATDRPTAAAAVSRDVNKDGILEIPTAELTINGSETTADSTGYVITWNTYSLQDNTLTPVCTSILNTAENYNLFLPSSEDNYGCQNDTVTRTATFFTYTQIGFNGNYLGRVDKFSIRVYTEEDWAEKEQDDEDILLSSSAFWTIPWRKATKKRCKADLKCWNKYRLKTGDRKGKRT